MNVAERYAHTMAIAEGKAELASEVLNIGSSTLLSNEEKLTYIRLEAEKAIREYEGLSRA